MVTDAYQQEDLDRAVARVGTGWHGVEQLVALARRRDDQLSRRSFLQLAGAGAAAAGLAACSSRPSREILPYASQPPELTPGMPLHYATALVEDGFATGVLVAASEGRPTKVEGNPDHAASLGGTRAIEQAAVLSLFDPERARSITDRGAPAAWSAVAAVLDEAAARRGDGLGLILEPTTSPITGELIGRLRAALPGAVLAFWAPFAPRASLDGNRLAFGRPLQTQLDLRAAEVVVALDADLAAGHPMSPAYARQLADRRRVVDARSTISRLYVAEPGSTATGVLADHRLAVRGSQIERVARALFAAVLGHPAMRGVNELPAAARARLASAPPDDRAPWIAGAADDLVNARGRSVVACGEHQPPVVHTLVAALNAVLGNIGHTVGYTEPVALDAGQPSHDLAAITQAMATGQLHTVIACGNPVYTAPAGLELAAALRRVERSVYLGLYDNETARACRFVVPGLHDLEQWGAARGYDGTLTPIQPLIEPLFGGRGVDDVLHHLLGDPGAAPRDRLAAAWARLVPDAPLDQALRRGAVGGAAPWAPVEVAWGALAPVIAAAGARDASPLELALRPHPFVHDGRYSNNPWLLELPEPITKLTWSNAAQLSPATAAGLGLADGDVVRLSVRGAGAIDLPAIVVPGLADGAIVIHAGFGRAGGEATARGLGGNAFALWPAVHDRHPAVTIDHHGAHRPLAITQPQTSMEDRPVALSHALAHLDDTAELAAHRGAQPSLYARRPEDGPQWAMSIDLTTCTGCSACVMACAAENNTPVVGEQQVRNGREMHWLRIDRYYAGADGHVAVQPMACQHCEDAPCEYVCPVEATSHSPDGLNEMTYNRCVGTRFCSNNCPYKVRRFNWFDFKEHSGLRIAARNPDVTVRDRGVMEKCTYCVQRIRRAEIAARVDEHADPRALEVQTACQQACPTQAITFGSLTAPGSAVAEHRHRPHSYAVLHDQGTRPRTQYLAKITNRREGLP